MFRYKLMQFMQGRYGSDSLNFALIIASVAVSLLNSILYVILRFSLLYNLLRIIVWALIIFAIYRMFSRNIEKRRRENEGFLKFTAPFRKNHNGGYNGYSNYGGYGTNSYDTNFYQQSKPQYKYFKCKKCKAKLRVPKGKGKITITCPKCRAVFKGKS